jgi:hypothetical protein
MSLKSILARLFGGGGGSDDAATGPSVEYNGYTIRAAPYANKGQYQTAGFIEKEIGGETKQHRFVRADLHASREQAIEFSLLKAQQIVDEQGDRIFG